MRPSSAGDARQLAGGREERRACRRWRSFRSRRSTRAPDAPIHSAPTDTSNRVRVRSPARTARRGADRSDARRATDHRDDAATRLICATTFTRDLAAVAAARHDDDAIDEHDAEIDVDVVATRRRSCPPPHRRAARREGRRGPASGCRSRTAPRAFSVKLPTIEPRRDVERDDVRAEQRLAVLRHAARDAAGGAWRSRPPDTDRRCRRCRRP